MSELRKLLEDCDRDVSEFESLLNMAEGAEYSGNYERSKEYLRQMRSHAISLAAILKDL